MEGWTDSFCLGGTGTPPWKSLRKSITSKNIRKTYVPYLFWKGSTTREVANEKLVNIATSLNQSEIKGNSIEPIRIEGWIETKDNNIFVYDFEKTNYASVNVEIGKMNGNIRVELFYDIKFESSPHAATGFGSDYENILNKSLLQFYDEKEMAFCSRIALENLGTINSINAMFVNNTPVEFDLHSNALAYLTKLGTKEQRSNSVLKMLKILKTAPKNEYGNNAVFGIAWTQIILEPLFAEGFAKEGLEYILQFYKPFVDIGSATWGEDFEPNTYNTAHGWGACINSLIIESVCGIKPLKPGWEKFQVAPKINEALDFRYTLMTPRGELQFT